MSIQVKLNGEPRELPDGARLTRAVAELTAAAAAASQPRSTATSYPAAPGTPRRCVTATRWKSSRLCKEAD